VLAEDVEELYSLLEVLKTDNRLLRKSRSQPSMDTVERLHSTPLQQSTAYLASGGMTQTHWVDPYTRAQALRRTERKHMEQRRAAAQFSREFAALVHVQCQAQTKEDTNFVHKEQLRNTTSQVRERKLSRSLSRATFELERARCLKELRSSVRQQNSELQASEEMSHQAAREREASICSVKKV
jgi:hypothetical protein